MPPSMPQENAMHEVPPATLESLRDQLNRIEQKLDRAFPDRSRCDHVFEAVEQGHGFFRPVCKFCGYQPRSTT